MMRAGILTISDRCARGLRADESGPALKRFVEKKGWRAHACAVVPDEADEIRRVLLDWCDRERLPLVLTTGGTGLGPRDVTPQATRGLLDQEVPGLGEFMRREGARENPLAALSRAAAGVRAQSLILNLPGSPQGAEQSLQSLWELLLHAMAMMRGEGHEKESGGAA